MIIAGDRGAGASLPVDERTPFRIEGDLLVMVDHDPIVSGAQVLGIDLRSGRVRWNRVLIGLGAIDHSQYGNRVHLASRRMGQITAFEVYGDESAGRYMEIVGPDGDGFGHWVLEIREPWLLRDGYVVPSYMP